MTIRRYCREALWRHGGYPEPFLKRDIRFSNRWQSLRRDQLVREDIRDLTQIQQLDRLEAMVHLLINRSTQQLVFGNLHVIPAFLSIPPVAG